MENNENNDLEDRLRRLNAIGIALSSQHREIDQLLEQILIEARRFTHAEAGTLYLMENDALTFAFAQNDLLDMSPKQNSEKSFPPVPLTKDSVSGYVALSGKTLNIADVYDEKSHNWEGPKNYDRLMGYRTQSMLVVPMNDHEGQVIGVLQLLNAKSNVGDYQPFSDQDETLIESLASQAAVAINNVRLIRDLEDLFNSFVRVMATAIDERSPYTGGHIRRVAELTMVLANTVNRCKEDPFNDINFNRDELSELHMAAWMHDVGKITTPEWIVDKPTKLTEVFDLISLLRLRFSFIRQQLEMLQAKGEIDGDEAKAKLAAVDSDWEVIERANHPNVMISAEDLIRLNEISKQTVEIDGVRTPYISPDELNYLSIVKGTLTDAQRLKINEHAEMSTKMLSQIPFTRKLRRVPEIAGAHHEKLDGSGYPQGLSGEEISLQARILAIADIFESLSADDRPYREQPLPRAAVLEIMQSMVDAGHIDSDLYELFIRERIDAELDRIKSETKPRAV